MAFDLLLSASRAWAASAAPRRPTASPSRRRAPASGAWNASSASRSSSGRRTARGSPRPASLSPLGAGRGRRGGGPGRRRHRAARQAGARCCGWPRADGRGVPAARVADHAARAAARHHGDADRGQLRRGRAARCCPVPRTWASSRDPTCRTAWQARQAGAGRAHGRGRPAHPWARRRSRHHRRRARRDAAGGEGAGIGNAAVPRAGAARAGRRPRCPRSRSCRPPPRSSPPWRPGSAPPCSARWRSPPNSPPARSARSRSRPRPQPEAARGIAAGSQLAGPARDLYARPAPPAAWPAPRARSRARRPRREA